MREEDRQLLIAAVDAYVARMHRVEGFSVWHDDAQLARRADNIVFVHAGWDAEQFCLSPEGELALREIFGRADSDEDPSTAQDVVPEA